MLAAPTTLALMEKVHDMLMHEKNVNEVRREIAETAKHDIDKQQREHLLRQQKRAIEQALGEEGGGSEETAELREQLAKANLPEAVQKEVDRELKRLGRMSENAADYQVARSYLELIAELPWHTRTEDALDLKHAQEVLDEDHYGLEDVKDRILESLAVMQLNPEAKAPILCLVGPPGVGKTSLGQSIARAMGRKFERLSLGGLHDEAELRGHRRTYIGAMPGRLIQAVRRAGVSNPVLMLDEIDKLGRDFRGDPAAALMEILDPAQNKEFRDNYLNLPFDLSKVFFITTANTLEGIPRPLLDRMEVMDLTGYSDREKREIARRYLIPRQRVETGLEEGQLDIPDDVLTLVIRRYTREAGVRELERVIGRLARKRARQVLEKHNGNPLPPITAENLTSLIGPMRFQSDKGRETLPAGVAAGLAWTEAGGDVLYIEAILTHRDERVMLTGQLGNVMQESAKAARSYIWSAAEKLGIDRKRIEKRGVHIHVPAGAVPKDGPSAGITMATALVSAYSEQPIRRAPRDDRRDHAVRPRAAGRRHQGKGAGGAPRRHEAPDPAEGQRGRSRQSARQRPQGTVDHAGRATRGSDRDRDPVVARRADGRPQDRQTGGRGGGFSAPALTRNRSGVIGNVRTRIPVAAATALATAAAVGPCVASPAPNDRSRGRSISSVVTAGISLNRRIG